MYIYIYVLAKDILDVHLLKEREVHAAVGAVLDEAGMMGEVVSSFSSFPIMALHSKGKHGPDLQ